MIMDLRETVLMQDLLAAINRWEVHQCAVEWQVLTDEQIAMYIAYSGAEPGDELWNFVELMTGRHIHKPQEESIHG